MVRELVSKQFSASTLMDGEGLVKMEHGMHVPEDDADLQRELAKLRELLSSALWGGKAWITISPKISIFGSLI